MMIIVVFGPLEQQQVYLEARIEAAIFLNFRVDMSGGRPDHLISQLSNRI
jgi:hypothetical protein